MMRGSLFKIVALALGYFGAGWLGLRMPSVGAHITLVWLPTGIAVAGLLRWGWGVWPGIYLGAVLVNLSIGSPWPVAAAIATGNTLAPLFARFLLRRTGFCPEFERQRDVLGFLAAAGGGMTVSATGGVASLYLAGLMEPEAMGAAWLAWWMGDTVGVLLAAPVLLTCSPRNFRTWGRAKMELALWILAAAAIAWFAFLQDYTHFGRTLPLAFLTLPLLAWAALRFGTAGAALGGFACAAAAAWGTAIGRGTFSIPGQDIGHFLLWLYMATAVLTGMLITALQAERLQVEKALRVSEEKLRGLYELSPLGIALTDMNGRYVEFNEAFRNVCGYPPEELQALDYWALTPKNYQAEKARQLDCLARTGRYGPYEKEYVRKDGSLVPLRLNGMLVTGRYGQDYIWSLVEDISERKRAEDELREQKEFLSAILANSSVGVVLLRERRLIWGNQRMSELFGYAAPADMLGLSTRLLYPSEEHYEAVGGEAYPALARGQRYAREQEMVRRDGSRVWIRVSGQSVNFGTLSAAESIWVFEDISESKAAEAELLATKERLALSISGADLALIDWDVPGGELNFGEGWTGLLGYPSGELPRCGAAAIGLIPPEDARAIQDALQSHLKGETPRLEMEVRMRHRDGRWVWILVRGMAVERGPDGRALRAAGTAMDITARKEAEAEIARLSRWNELLLNSAGEGIYGVDPAGRCTFINPAALAMLGFAREEILAHSPHHLFHHHHRYGVAYAPQDCPVQSTLRDGVRRRVEDAFFRRNGEVFPVQMTVTPMQEGGRIVGAEVVFQDIARRKAMEAELLQLATTDSLTGAANRRHFLEQVDMELARIKRFDERATLLMVDIDHFKRVNDSYGHAVGDLVLKHFADLSRQRLRQVDFFGRLGGEEFGILLPGTDGAGAREFAEQLRAHLAGTPTHTAKGTIAITVSIGITEFAASDEAPDSILARADGALYRAKARGRNTVDFWGADLEVQP
ncbi:MAG: PAS domain S-box protein [Rhodocyclaceae bacterium]|jgi:diguanylate cyclase (GGDEF)-like protein/PAS domain S-box-containing protein|nr:PAS domain S-box protein [Rhodocyclaceae bacterium]